MEGDQIYVNSHTFTGEVFDFTHRVTIKSFRTRLWKMSLGQTLTLAEFNEDVRGERKSFGALYLQRSDEEGRYYKFILHWFTDKYARLTLYQLESFELAQKDNRDSIGRYTNLEFCEYELPEILEFDDDVILEVKVHDISTYQHIHPPEAPNSLNLLVRARQKRLDLVRLLDEEKYTDFVIRVSGEDIKVHRNILAFNSKFFENMFDSGMIEAQTGCVEVADFTPETIRAMLRYIYSGKLEDINDDEKKESLFYSYLLIAADKYQIDDLKEDCESILCNLITPDTADDLMNLALTYRTEALKKKLACFLMMQKPTHYCKRPRY